MDEHGTVAHSLVTKPSDADGLITLPPLHAGTREGTLTLRLTTERGITINVRVAVQKPVE